MTESLWDVAIPLPLRRCFVYAVPDALGTPARGQRVLVPFGRRTLTGYLIAPAAPSAPYDFRLRHVLSLLDPEPALPEELLEFLIEAAAYYMHPLGEVLRAALPAGLDAGQKHGVALQPRVGVRYEKLVHPTDQAPAALAALSVRAKRRAAVLDLVLRSAPARLVELRAAFKDAAAQIKRLASDGLVVVSEQPRAVDPFQGVEVDRDQAPTLTAEQQNAVAAITLPLRSLFYQGFLLHGVTGSGKTEVYLHAIDEALRRGKGALVLVPEIALTPQLVRRYRARFGNDVAVLHSAQSDQERFEQWQLLRSGRVRVAIGVRSAVFAPIRDLGVIVVDEEHDGSFKQERGFLYHARDLALLRAARCRAVAVLGSATPSLETYHNASRGKLTRLCLVERPTGQRLPSVEIIDLKHQRGGTDGQSLVSDPLYEAMAAALQNHEQVILFLNRRGFSPALLCEGCGQLYACDSCAVSLTLHRRPLGLICHYCGARRPVPEVCPDCGSAELKPLGTGTQKAEEVLGALFPEARIGRLDRDVAAGARIEEVLDRLRRGELDVLVGTQMVTKGHDFPGVTLVGVLSADVGLNLPDFRAAERTFQLLTQVAGRAGRAARPGHALIQTYNPAHPAIRCAQSHDYETFARQELLSRAELAYPPFGKLAALRLSSPEEAAVEAAARELFIQLKEARAKLRLDRIELLGPAPAPLTFVQNRYRYRILLRGPRQDQLRALLEQVQCTIEAPPSTVRINLDIDPISML